MGPGDRPQAGPLYPSPEAIPPSGDVGRISQSDQAIAHPEEQQGGQAKERVELAVAQRTRFAAVQQLRL